MPVELLVPLAIFVVLLVVVLALLRRVGVLVAESRESMAFRTEVEDLAARVDATLGDISGRIDLLRRQQIEPDEIAVPLDTALETLVKYNDEARALAGPPVVAAAKLSFTAEIERAERALEMVEHGASILGSMSSGHRFGEAQTAIKRGYLNVMHARDAIARHASDIATARSADEIRWLGRRRGARQT